MSLVPVSARSALLQGQIDVTDGTLTAGLFVGYTYSAAHEFLDDAGTPVSSVLVDAVSVVDGEVFGTCDVFASPGTGDPVDAVWFYMDTGVAGTSRLVALVDRYGDLRPLSIPRTGSAITLPPWRDDRMFALGTPG